MPAYPTVQLVATAPAIRHGQPLPLRLRVANPTATALVGASAEVVIEVERGVLLTWNTTLAEVGPGDVRPDAVTASEPAWVLPANVPDGAGRVAVTMRAADGALLATDEIALAVAP
jgi:hypothetical protein